MCDSSRAVVFPNDDASRKSCKQRDRKNWYRKTIEFKRSEHWRNNEAKALAISLLVGKKPTSNERDEKKKFDVISVNNKDDELKTKPRHNKTANRNIWSNNKRLFEMEEYMFLHVANTLVIPKRYQHFGLDGGSYITTATVKGIKSKTK